MCGRRKLSDHHEPSALDDKSWIETLCGCRRIFLRNQRGDKARIQLLKQVRLAVQDQPFVRPETVNIELGHLEETKRFERQTELGEECVRGIEREPVFIKPPLGSCLRYGVLQTNRRRSGDVHPELPGFGHQSGIERNVGRHPRSAFRI
jgi:hypothetical protein